MSQPSTPSPDTPAPVTTGRRRPERPASARSGLAARPGSLAGLIVADFSRVLAGPYCTMLLADLGADVIKVESPSGDDTRGWVPPATPDGRSTYYLAVNRNKRSVALDLRDPGDLAAARELARRADVVVHNSKPGALPAGRLPPHRVPLRAAAHRRRGPDRDRGQRRPVPQAVRAAGRARAGRRPAVRQQRRADRAPRRAAPAARRAAGGAPGRGVV